MAVVCISRGKLDLLESAVAALKGEMPRSKIVELSAQFHRFSFDQLRERYIATPPSLVLTLTRSSSIEGIARTFHDPKTRIQVCDILMSGLQHQSPEDEATAAQWRRDQDDILISDTYVLKRDRAALIVDAVLKHENADWLLQRYGYFCLIADFRLSPRSVIPFVQRHANNSAFALAIVNQLHAATQQHELQPEVFVETFKRISDDIVSNFFLPRKTEIATGNDVRSAGAESQSVPQTLDRDSFMPTSDLIAFYHLLLDHNMQTELAKFRDKMEFEVAQMGSEYMSSLLFPFMKALVDYAKRTKEEDEHSSATLHIQGALNTILTAYMKRCVGNEPHKVLHWGKDPIGCGRCKDCPKLDAFLVSCAKEVEHFSVDATRRGHLKDQVQRCGQKSGISAKDQRHGDKCVLVVTKKEKTGVKAHHKWAARAAKTKQEILSIASEEDLRRILGDDFDALTNFAPLLARNVMERTLASVVPETASSREPLREVQAQSNSTSPRDIHGVPSTKRNSLACDLYEVPSMKRRAGTNLEDTQPKAKCPKHSFMELAREL